MQLDPNHAGDQQPRFAKIEAEADLPGAWRSLGLAVSRPVLVLVGGASGMSEDQVAQTQALFQTALPELMLSVALTIVDGGTDIGVMQAVGRARKTMNNNFPLVGVVIEQLTRELENNTGGEAPAALEPNHSHFIVTPGDDWSESARWISLAAGSLAADQPSLTILFNGGQVAWQDADESIKAGRHVVVAAGSGRTADAIARTKTGELINKRAAALLKTGLISIIDPYKHPEQLLEVLHSRFRTKA